MNKENTVHMHYEILFSHKKNSVIHDNMDRTESCIYLFIYFGLFEVK
jgi:hypothetical protein